MTLRREVEAPRTGTGLWLPLMALASAAMLTIVSGVAVMTRAPRPEVVAPAVDVPMSIESTGLTEAQQADIERRIDASRKRMEADRRRASERIDAQPRVLCRAPVRRGNLDGEPQLYDECIAPRGVLPASVAPAPTAKASEAR